MNLESEVSGYVPNHYPILLPCRVSGGRDSIIICCGPNDSMPHLIFLNAHFTYSDGWIPVGFACLVSFFFPLWTSFLHPHFSPGCLDGVSCKHHLPGWAGMCPRSG